MISSLSDALIYELSDIPEEIQTRVLDVVKKWDNGEIWRKLKRDHDARTQRLYEKFINHGDLVFDVGANVGERSEIFLSLGASVVAVEPHAGCVNKLRNKFSREPRVTIVPKALGERAGTGSLFLAEECPGISSMSEEWIRDVTETNRFGCQWSKSSSVEISTLDDLVSKFGMPAFAKIDVEGSEDKVLAGLSTPIPSISFEFTPEHLFSAERCVSKLESLGQYEFTYSVGETMELHPEWVSGQDIMGHLGRFVGDTEIYGDVYARFL